MRQKDPEKRFAALLLFQFRVMVDGDPGKRRLCEKRIINFRASDGTAALKEAKRRGRASQHSHKNSDGNRVYFEFVGVQDLLCLDPACDPDEVWYDTIGVVVFAAASILKDTVNRIGDLLDDGKPNASFKS